MHPDKTPAPDGADTSKTELLPCPFCGIKGAAELDSSLEHCSEDEYEILSGEERWRVVCNIHEGGCGGACGYESSKAEAKDAWNTRAENAKQADEIARLREHNKRMSETLDQIGNGGFSNSTNKEMARRALSAEATPGHAGAGALDAKGDQATIDFAQVVQRLTPKRLAAWILSLPQDVQDGAVDGIVGGLKGGQPFAAKRAVAYRWKDGSGAGIYVNPMGTHASDATLADVERVSIIGGDGKVYASNEADNSTKGGEEPCASGHQNSNQETLTRASNAPAAVQSGGEGQAASPQLAEGHNPAQITVAEVGEDWRLLRADEVVSRGDQYWCEDFNAWHDAAFRGLPCADTYRRRIAPEETR